MRKKLNHLIAAFTMIVFMSCGSSTETKKDEKPNVEANSTATTETGPKSASCCFKTEAEGIQFFPAPNEEITYSTKSTPGGTIIGCNDPDAMSNFSVRYKVNGNEYLMKLFDHCSKPKERLPEEYARRLGSSKKVAASDQTFEEIPGNEFYKGLAMESPKFKSSFLWVMVDERFEITLSGFSEKCTIADMKKIFALVPVEKLAAFGK